MQYMNYDLELEKAAELIEQNNVKKVCIQLPDGLKPKAGEIAAKLEQQTGAQTIIWAGSCYGACDVPLQVELLGVDMIIQWGHSEWR